MGSACIEVVFYISYNDGPKTFVFSSRSSQWMFDWLRSNVKNFCENDIQEISTTDFINLLEYCHTIMRGGDSFEVSRMTKNQVNYAMHWLDHIKENLFDRKIFFEPSSFLD